MQVWWLWTVPYENVCSVSLMQYFTEINPTIFFMLFKFYFTSTLGISSSTPTLTPTQDKKDCMEYSLTVISKFWNPAYNQMTDQVWNLFYSTPNSAHTLVRQFNEVHLVSPWHNFLIYGDSFKENKLKTLYFPRYFVLTSLISAVAQRIP